MALYKLIKIGVRHEDGRTIVGSVENRDWREFLKWQADGGVPDQIDPDPPPTQEQLDVIAAKSDADVIALAGMTPAQAAAFVQASVVDLPSAKLFMKRVAVVLSVLSKRL